MRKIIILLLFVGAVISSIFGILKYQEYEKKKVEIDNTDSIDKKIKEVEVEIEKNKEELQKIQEDSKPVLEEIAVWQKKIEDLEKLFG